MFEVKNSNILVYWTQKNHLKALYQLGSIYKEGLDVKKDVDEDVYNKLQNNNQPQIHTQPQIQRQPQIQQRYVQYNQHMGQRQRPITQPQARVGFHL